MQHELKTWPQYFDSVERGFKTVELRQDDRNYEVGDTLILREWEPSTQTYTGRQCIRMVSHILRGEPWLATGFCALSIVDTNHLKRYAALERLYEAQVSRTEAFGQQMTISFRPDEHDADKKFIAAQKTFYQAEDDIDEILEQLEAMGGVSHQQRS